MNKPFYKSLNLQFFGENKDITADSIKKLETDFNEAWKTHKSLLDQQADEMRRHGETSSETAKKVETAEQKQIQLEKDLKDIREQVTKMEAKGNRLPFSGGQVKTVGQQFIESEQFKSAAERGLNHTDAFNVKSFFDMERKDLDSTDPNGGLLAQTLILPGIITAPDENLRLRDILNVQTTTANSVEYIEETGFTNAAAPVAEKALKPQSDITFDQKTAQVRTIAHWLPATRQILADAQQLRNYVDNRLIYGLKLVEEAQILFGDGVGENLLGLMNHTGVQNAGTRAAEDTFIDKIRRSITMARIAGYPVTGVVLNPADWETIELSKGTDGHYIFTSVNEGGQMRVFRVPVIESTSMTEGEYLLGGFGLAAQLLDREQANVRVSESHTDYFARNMVAILGEERIAMPIYRPEALVKGSFAETATV